SLRKRERRKVVSSTDLDKRPEDAHGKAAAARLSSVMLVDKFSRGPGPARQFETSTWLLPVTQTKPSTGKGNSLPPPSPGRGRAGLVEPGRGKRTGRSLPRNHLRQLGRLCPPRSRLFSPQTDGKRSRGLFKIIICGNSRRVSRRAYEDFRRF